MSDTNENYQNDRDVMDLQISHLTDLIDSLSQMNSVRDHFNDTLSYNNLADLASYVLCVARSSRDYMKVFSSDFSDSKAYAFFHQHSDFSDLDPDAIYNELDTTYNRVTSLCKDPSHSTTLDCSKNTTVDALDIAVKKASAKFSDSCIEVRENLKSCLSNFTDPIDTAIVESWRKCNEGYIRVVMECVELVREMVEGYCSLFEELKATDKASRAQGSANVDRANDNAPSRKRAIVDPSVGSGDLVQADTATKFPKKTDTPLQKKAPGLTGSHAPSNCKPPKLKTVSKGSFFRNEI